MAATLLPWIAQFFDDLGKPLAGGWLYFYQAGLPGTPQPVYTDPGLTIPFPNPVPLDSAGRPYGATGPIYLLPSPSYLLIIESADFVQVGPTYDNITPNAPAV
jgi:hypothetical protein